MNQSRTTARVIMLSLITGGLFTLATNMVATELQTWLGRVPGYSAMIWGAFALGLTVTIAVTISDQRLASKERPDGDLLRRSRKQLIEKVRTTWIEGFLDQALYRIARIELELQSTPEAINHPLNIHVQELGKPARRLPAGYSIRKVFEDNGGALLILGGPGSGKTTLLLELARELLDVAYRVAEAPIPVVLHLPSWSAQRASLQTWVLNQLHDLYDVSTNIAEHWLDSNDIILLLDGLDEVVPEYRLNCLEQINEFRRNRGFIRVAVCCRDKDYEELNRHLRLQGAVFIKKLEANQVGEYLRAAGAPLANLRLAMDRDRTLLELFQTPLMLSIGMLAFQDSEIREISEHLTIQQKQQHLFREYVNKMFTRRTKVTRYSRVETLRWLEWLATSMSRHGETIFYLESLQSNRLVGLLSKRKATFGVAVVSGLWGGCLGEVILALILGPLIGLSGWLAHGIIAGPLLGISCATIGWICFELAHLASGHDQEPATRRKRTVVRLVAGAGLGFVFGFIFGSVTGAGGGLFFAGIFGLFGGPVVTLLLESGGLAAEWVGENRHPAERIAWSWPRMRLGLVGGLVFGVVFSLATQFSGGLFVLLVSTLTLAFTGGISTGTRVSKERARPNQGTWRSLRTSGIIAGLATTIGILFAHLASFGLAVGSIPGKGAYLTIANLELFIASAAAWMAVLISLDKGGMFFVEHQVVRLILRWYGVAPLRYLAFLEYAVSRIFLLKAGGGYTFVHRTLMEYFVAMANKDTGKGSTS